MTQEIPPHHQGRITGLAGVAAWGFSPAQSYFGRLVDQTGSFSLGLGLVGWLPDIYRSKLNAKINRNFASHILKSEI